METRSKIFGPGLISFVFVLIFFTSNLVLDNIKADDLIDQSIQSSMPADTIYSYNFEYGLNGWWVDNGVWEVGTPVGTAPCSLTAHSGNSFAGTNLAGEYPINKDTRLISPAVNLPSIGGGETLRLTFWHQFTFGRDYDNGVWYEDYGWVKIQVYNPDSLSWGSWQNIGTIYTDGSVIWSKVEIEIPSYAGKRVRFGFHLFSDSYGTRCGWYVDDVCVIKAPESVSAPVCWNFEEGWGDWWVDNGVWEVGHPASTAPCSLTAYSGNSFAGTNLNGLYPNYSNTRLVSPAVDLPSIGGEETLRLTFWHQFTFGRDYHNGVWYVDYGWVKIQVYNPDSLSWGSWQNIGTIYTDGSVIWSKVEIEIPSYAGKRVRFGFHLFSDSYGTRCGWYVDDVSIFKFIRGDANGDNSVSVSDVVYLVSYLFKSGPPPQCPPAPYTSCGDANSDNKVTIADVVYLVSYLFKGGPAPKC